MSLLLLIIGLALFVSLVVVHEFGHFMVARRNGVTVEEFGIGFPPTAWSRKLKSGMLFSLNWLPLGGFVRLKGEHDADKEKGSYGRASLSVKTRIMLAGVVMNLLAAFVIFTVLALVGMPKLVDNQFTVKNDTKVSRNATLVGYVEPASPAAKAGLEPRDQLVALGLPSHLQTVSDSAKLPNLTKQYAGKTISVQFLRDNQLQAKTVTLRSNQEVEASQKTNNPKGYLGIAPSDYQLRRSTWSAPIVSAGLISQFTELTFVGLGRAVGGLLAGHASQASQQVAGPVGIFVLLKDGSLLGYQFILMIIGVISLTLAIMNVLPIPALDGGRLFVTLVFRGIRKPLTQRTEEWIHGTGFALLMLLFVLITVVDVRRFF